MALQKADARKMSCSPCMLLNWIWNGDSIEHPDLSQGNGWHVKPVRAACAQPVTCCLSCACPCCVAWHQRQEILDLSGQAYTCCGGRFADWGCCLCGRCGRCCPMLEEPFDAPNLGLFLEAFCCTPFAIVGNRFLIQDEFERESDEWDDCICCCFAAFQMAQHADELQVIKKQQSPSAILTQPVNYGAAGQPLQQSMRV
ncbi:unnamed protein product [Effrenium voratum]|nr:unnamed protein product [Effrenium voratum]